MLPENAAEEKRQEREQNIHDRRKVLESNKETVETAINDLEATDDPELQSAAEGIRELAHVITGDDRFDPDA